MSYAIQFQNMSYTVNKQNILHNISQNINTGAITTLIGPSGAGKTTLLKMCNALLSPTAGTIYVQGQTIDTFTPTTLRQKIGIVLQNAPILRTTVFNNLALLRHLQKQELTQEEALHMLTDVGLDEALLMRQATDLSGGQKQKLAIARTLLNRSEILLLDEITSALDPHSVQEIEQLIIKIRQKGITIIWITHNIEQAQKMGDYIWVMAQGQVVASGTTNEIMNSNDAHVQAFLLGGRQ
ncbi:phosphate ABC transporter ATP-binding protein [Metasolibacillus meyeri]|uniref:Phosphate ABC transporter ATP-binding protein n=1 Tax=Metasolibacillus meyeri TaxID=1071052 RepID=A0AAW9NRK2_9BACL|nr:phosphate ABC transporter ATP-binding protein [Metasolibacillus meyeri]MEC1180165.1 phosphate ABC transporter ATP-binding protein [Metasolibacillus meyeri]